MTHLETMVQLLEDMGLKRQNDEEMVRDAHCGSDDGYSVIPYDGDDGHVVTIGRGKHGYSGFYCTFHFDKDGKYEAHGCAE